MRCPRYTLAVIFDSNPANSTTHLLLGAVTTSWIYPPKCAFALDVIVLLPTRDWMLWHTNEPVSGAVRAMDDAYNVAHIADVKRLGINNHVERYTDSPHVVHPCTDPWRYWSARRGCACAVHADAHKRAVDAVNVGVLSGRPFATHISDSLHPSRAVYPGCLNNHSFNCTCEAAAPSPEFRRYLGQHSTRAVLYFPS